MNRHVSILLLLVLLLAACATQPQTDEEIQLPSGIWEGAQEAGEVDWSMTLNFENCTTGEHCASVYYVPCSGTFDFLEKEAEQLVFQENISDYPDQCFSGATVRLTYRGQDQPLTAAWFGPDGSAGPTAEFNYQDPAAAPIIEGIGQQVALLRNPGSPNWGFTAVDGNLWIPQSDTGTILRIDAKTLNTLAEIKIGDPSQASFNVDPNRVAVSGDDVWVTQRADHAVARIDPSTNQVVHVVPVGVEPFNILIDGDNLWVAAYEEGVLLRVDTRTGEVVSTLDIDTPSDMAVINDAVWVTEHRQGNLVQIDPQTNSVTDRIALPPGSRPSHILFYDDSIWVANRTTKSISRIDPDTQEQVAIPMPQNAVHISAGGGHIWVALDPGPEGETDMSKYAIARVDPKTNEVMIIPFPGASSTAFLDGTLWIDDVNDMSGGKIYGIRVEP